MTEEKLEGGRWPPEFVDGVKQMLTSFGYPIDRATVVEYMTYVADGNRPRNGPQMFIRGVLDQAGITKDERNDG